MDGMDIKEVLAANLRALMAHRKISQMALADKSGVSQSTIGRWLKMEVAATVEGLHAVASHLGCQTWQLLVPGLEADSLPALKPITAEERALYEKIRAAAQDLAKYQP